MNPVYRTIGRELFDDIATALDGGRMVILLGGRDAGKRYVLHRLNEHIQTSNTQFTSLPAPVVSLEIDAHPKWDSYLLKQQIYEAARRANAEWAPNNPENGPLLMEWAALSREMPLLCLVANIDYLPHTAALTLLQELRYGARAGRFLVLLTGESHLLNLIDQIGYSDSPPVTFVLQGFEEDSFSILLEKRIESLGFPATLEERAEIYNQTGGQLHLLRHVIWAAEESKFRHASQEQSFSWLAFLTSDRLLDHLYLYGLDLFRDAVRQLNTDQDDSLELLAQLCKPCKDNNASPVTVKVMQYTPTLLELSGLVHRNVITQVLTWSSELARRFAHRYFTTRRWAHLYAIHKKWNSAREYFRKTDREELESFPCDGEDLAELNQVVDSYCSELHRLYSRIPIADHLKETDEAPLSQLNAIRSLTHDVLYYALGFNDVGFWRKEYTQEWEPAVKLSATPNPEVRFEIQTILNDYLSTEQPEETAKIAKELHPLYIGIILPGLRSVSNSSEHNAFSEYFFPVDVATPNGLNSRDNEREAVIVRDVSSHPRKGHRFLANRILEYYSTAYTQIISQLAQKQRLEARAKFSAIIGDAFHKLYQNPADAVDIVQRIARLLIESFPFKRVVISLVDTRRTRIKGEAQSFCQQEVNLVDLAQATNYPLSDPENDIHTKCVLHKQFFRIKNASIPSKADDLTWNHQLFAAADMQGVALLPIVGTKGEGLGTLLIERLDCTVPTDSEMEDLLSFATKLASVLEQSERINLLTCALEEVPHPIAVVDARGYLHFVNSRGAQLFEIRNHPIHFADLDEQLNFPPKLEPFRNILHREVLENGRKASFFLSESEAEHEPRRIHGVPFIWRQYRGGALIVGESLGFAFSTGAAMRTLVSVSSDRHQFLNSLAIILDRMHIKSGRLYRKYPRGGEKAANELRPLDAFDTEDPDRVSKFRFLDKSATLRLEGDEALTETWKCFGDLTGDSKESPRITAFCHYPNAEYGLKVTALGLECINVPKPFFNRVLEGGDHKELEMFRKTPESIWIDIPIVLNGTVFGKATLDCTANFGPEHFALCDGLARLITLIATDRAAISDLLRAKRDWAEKSRIQLSRTKEEFVGFVIKISEMMSPLAVLFSAYERRTSSHPDIGPLNERLESIYDNLQNHMAELLERAQELKIGLDD